MTTRPIASIPRAGRRRRKTCPICGRPPQPGHEPFCSRRCADEDLRRWLSGDYRVPTDESVDPDAEGRG
jgi:endogenous inhibitor of DNA gyrase (YacG/DUF329 family)